jgi:hypothetical protein
VNGAELCADADQQAALPQYRFLRCVQALKQLRKQAARSGMQMICIATKVDEYDLTVAENVARVATSRSVDLMRRCISKHTDLALNQVPCWCLLDMLDRYIYMRMHTASGAQFLC